MGGGDLLNLLIERDVFDEDFARFYTAEVMPIPRLPYPIPHVLFLLFRFLRSYHCCTRRRFCSG